MAKRKYGNKGVLAMGNNGGGSIMEADWSKPCGLPMGSISRDLGNNMYMPLDNVNIKDMYQGVEKSMREDAAEIKKRVDPKNW